MNILILGAGRMAYGLVFDILKNKSLKRVTIVDKQQAALDKMKDHFNNLLLEFKRIEGENLHGLKLLFKEADGAISALPTELNLDITQLAIDCKTHFVDLGGNNTIAERQFRLDDQAKKSEVGVIPGCGLAPGMASVVTAFAIDQLARVDDVQIRVGNLPLLPQTPLKYNPSFSIIVSL